VGANTSSASFFRVKRKIWERSVELDLKPSVPRVTPVSFKAGWNRHKWPKFDISTPWDKKAIASTEPTPWESFVGSNSTVCRKKLLRYNTLFSFWSVTIVWMPRSSVYFYSIFAILSIVVRVCYAVYLKIELGQKIQFWAELRTVQKSLLGVTLPKGNIPWNLVCKVFYYATYTILCPFC